MSYQWSGSGAGTWRYYVEYGWLTTAGWIVRGEWITVQQAGWFRGVWEGTFWTCTM